jgi:putative ATP-dependent endonuclease of the OLD family
MAAIRHVRILRFRGFGDFETSFAGHAVVVGEPGAGRSDLIEALGRALDSDYLRYRHGDELDFNNLDTSRPAEVTVTIGSLGDTSASPLLPKVELLDRQTNAIVPELVEAADFNPDRHEEVLRLSYRMEAQADGTFDEYVYWPKTAQPGQERAAMASVAERAEIPFINAKSVAGKPIDLAVRSPFRQLANSQDGEDVERAVDRLIDALEHAADEFAGQERVAAALEGVLAPLRRARRIPPTAEASEFVRFLPQGGARSGVVRGLDVALELADGPELPLDRHGSTVTAALRASLLLALAGDAQGAIVAVDDFGSDLEPLMARHLAGRLRSQAGQLILTSRQPHIAAAFRPDELVRLSDPSTRVASSGKAITELEGREIARFLTTQLTPAMTASAVVIVDGPHDRLALDALGRRLAALGRLEPFAAAGIVIADAEGTGSLRPLASAARSLGFHTVLLLDNDQAEGQLPHAIQDAIDAADVSILLPPRVALERLLFAGVSDTEVLRAIAAVAGSYQGVTAPPQLASLTGGQLRRAAAKFLKQTPSLHEAFVAELGETELSPRAGAVLQLIYEQVEIRGTGLIRLGPDYTMEL